MQNSISGKKAQRKEPRLFVMIVGAFILIVVAVMQSQACWESLQTAIETRRWTLVDAVIESNHIYKSTAVNTKEHTDCIGIEARYIWKGKVISTEADIYDNCGLHYWAIYASKAQFAPGKTLPLKVNPQQPLESRSPEYQNFPVFLIFATLLFDSVALILLLFLAILAAQGMGFQLRRKS